MCFNNYHLTNYEMVNDIVGFEELNLMRKECNKNILTILQNAKWIKIISILIINFTLDYYFLKPFQNVQPQIRYFSDLFCNSRGNLN